MKNHLFAPVAAASFFFEITAGGTAKPIRAKW
jgi:hypothetical protein